MSHADVIEHLRAEHGLDCSVVEVLDGFFGGSILLRTPTGGRLVLKTWRDRSLNWAIQVQRVLEAARQDRWPSPAWRVVGETPDGVTFSVQEHAIGVPVSHIDDPLARGIVDINRRQAGHAVRETELFDHGNRARHLLSDDLNCWKAQLRSHSKAGDGLVQTVLERVTSSASLDGNDLVHGDYSRGNLLAADGFVTGIVDLDNLGWGNRALDLIDAYRQMILLDDPVSARQIIRCEIEKAATVEGFYAGFAFWTIANLGWAVGAKAAQVQERIAKLQAFVDSEEF